MNEIGLSFGKPTFIEELNKQKTDMIGSSVCVTGKLVDHNVNKCSATLMDPCDKQQLNVDTSLIEPFDAKIGSLFQMIGEIEESGNSGNEIMVKTRVIRCVDGLDITMYKKSVEILRTYLSKRNS